MKKYLAEKMLQFVPVENRMAEWEYVDIENRHTERRGGCKLLRSLPSEAS